MKPLNELNELPQEIQPEIKSRAFAGVGILGLSIIISIIFSSLYFIVFGFVISMFFLSLAFSYIKAYKKGEMRVVKAVVTSKEKKITPLQSSISSYILYCRDDEKNSFEISVKRKDYRRFVEGSEINIYFMTSQLHSKGTSSYSLQGFLKIE